MPSPYTSVKGGDWNDPTVWGQATYPQTAGDVVTIATGHTVIYNVNSATILGAITISVGGKLQISNSMDTRLASSGLIAVNGAFWAGESELVPLPATYKFILETSVVNACFFERHALADTRFFGSALYQPIREAVLAVAWTSGQTFTVVGNATSWRTNDAYAMAARDYVSSPFSGGINFGTVASAVLNGSNTDITINEVAPGGVYKAGRPVFNLDSHNIIIRMIGAVNNKNSYFTTAASAYMRGTNTLSQAQANPWLMSNVTFHGLTYVRENTGLHIKRCFFKNGYYVNNGSNLCLYEDVICFSNYRAFASASAVKLLDCRIIGAIAQAVNAIYGIDVINTNFYCCAAVADGTVINMRFINCIMARNSIMHSSGYHEDCQIFGGERFTTADKNIFFKRCTIGRNIDSSDLAPFSSGFYLSAGNEGGYLMDCSLYSFGGITDPYFAGGENNISRLNFKGFYFQNHNLTGQNLIYKMFGRIDTNATHNLASKSLKVTPFSNCSLQPVSGLGLLDCDIEIINWTESNVPASAQSRRVYVQGTGWSILPTAAQLYLEVEYYNAAGAWTTTLLKSTEVLAANGTWKELTVSFVPGRVGPVTYRVVLAKYEANALVYLDHALYYSATEFLEAAFDWGKSVLPMAPPPTFPATTNVRALTAYGTPLAPQVGVMDQAAEIDVEKDVVYDNGTKIGRFWKPTEAQTLLGVGFGADGTEFVGELDPVLPTKEIEGEVYMPAMDGEITGFVIEGEVVMEA